MVITCIVKGCDNKQKVYSTVMFHRIPIHPQTEESLAGLFEHGSNDSSTDAEELACLLRAFYKEGLYLNGTTPKGYGHTNDLQITDRTKWSITQRCKCPFAFCLVGLEVAVAYATGEEFDQFNSVSTNNLAAKSVRF